MQGSIINKRHLVVTAFVAGALTIAMPVASADVVDRAVAAKLSEQPSFQGSPDAIERALAAKQPSFQGSPDAIERSLAAKQPSFQGYPDVVERAAAARHSPTTFQGSPDAMDRYAGRNPSYARVGTEASAPVVVSTDVSSGGVDWGDFGLGAGLALALLGLGMALIAIRRSQQGMKPA